jgi:peptidoglycan hydrolase-like protein with peptidoglycan-binding domain
MRSFLKDTSVRDHKLSPGTLRRILAFAMPYRGHIAAFLLLVVLDAAFGAATPLVLRAIIDQGITPGRVAVVVSLSLVVALLALLAPALWLVLGRDASRNGSRAANEAGTATVPVLRRTLVVRESVSGTLGYGDGRTLTSASRGTVTRLPAEGSIVRRGRPLYSVDGAPAAVLLYGDRPAWRTMAEGVADGEDVRRLEQNLAALGYYPGRVDGHFDLATRAAVQSWQRALGLEQIGVHDNFFDLGGESFAAVQVISKLKQELGMEIPAVSLYEALTVRSLVDLLSSTRAAARANEQTLAQVEEREEKASRRKQYQQMQRAKKQAPAVDRQR